MVPRVVLCTLLVGCGRPPEAPRQLDELTHYLYREWANEDPAVMEAGLANLRDFLNRQDLSAEAALDDRAWELTPTTKADLATITWPTDRDPADTIGIGVARQSAWPVEDHAAWQLRRSQLPSEPSAVDYVRDFSSPDNPECFAEGDCEVLVTVNQITRKNLLMSVEFTLDKGFRWVELDDGEVGMVARSWIAESAHGESGKSIIWQSYSLDVWIPGRKGAQRYQVLWSEADVAGASDAIQLGTVKKSTDDHFEATDVAIEEYL